MHGIGPLPPAVHLHCNWLTISFVFSFQIAEAPDAWIPVDVNFIKEFWLPDAEILNLKEFKTLDVLSKLEGLWLNRHGERHCD